MKPKLYRSHDRVMGGVCGGIADYLGLDRRQVRVVTMVAVIFMGFPMLAYVVLYMILPEDPRKPFDLNDYRAQ